MKKEKLTLANLEDGDCMNQFNKAMEDLQDAIFRGGGSGSITLKLAMKPSQDGSQIMGVRYDISTTKPKISRQGIYARGKHYLESATLSKRVDDDRQASFDEVDRVVQMNRTAD